MEVSERIRHTDHGQDKCRGQCHAERGEIADEVKLLEAELAGYRQIRAESHGVDGLHLNGDLATWDWLEAHGWFDVLR